MSSSPSETIANQHESQAIAAFQAGDFEGAAKELTQALDLRPESARLHHDLGVALAGFLRFDRAVASYDKAISLKPDYAEAYAARGMALMGLKKLEAAITSFEFALFMNPNLAEAQFHRAEALRSLNESEPARAAYQKILESDPENGLARGQMWFMEMQICDWVKAEASAKLLLSGVQRSANPPAPFPFLAFSESPAVLKDAAQHYARIAYPPRDELGPIPMRGKAQKLHIGYYSSDFENSAVMHLMAGVFECHDRSAFEVTAFSFGRDVADDMRTRLTGSVDRFIDVRMTSDRDIARMSREMGIDIAVDMKGHTRDRRMGIFAYRAAPIQVGYMGYPSTTGTPYIDYILADEIVIPREHRMHFSEKVAWLPHNYLANDRRRVFPPPNDSRAGTGLPENAFVFCGFNAPYKISPATFDGWMRILKKVEGSVLWLLEDNLTAAKNLQREAEKRGVDPSRLIFSPRAPISEHLARHGLADLLLDTLPHNGHTTASDALWMGLPVLTCLGNTFPGRVAASLLRALNVPELITFSQADYEAAAIRLAGDSAGLSAIRQKLRNNRLSAPLFDTALFTANLEAVYRTMHARHLNGAPPEHIEGPQIPT